MPEKRLTTKFRPRQGFVLRAPRPASFFSALCCLLRGQPHPDRGYWRMAEVIWVDGGARNPKVPTLFQVADVDTGVINWINADLVTHICPRV